MIATILPNSSSFAGIAYSEKKISQGLADFVEAENFGYLELLDHRSPVDYVEYLNRWSDKNSRIKNPQFHVSISCKGRSYSKEKLIEIGKEWLYGMGYKGNPVIFYFHKDTNNNHIHIVTSRIDKNGKKIDNNNEKYRSRQILNKIMKDDIKYNCRRDFANALLYKFDNQNQFQAILESIGYKTDIKDGYIIVSKEGVALLQKDLKMVDWFGRRNTSEKDRNKTKQLKAILFKYKDRMSTDALISFLKSGFGCDLLFFGEKKNPYGFMVIDHMAKSVYKGGVFMPVKELLNGHEKHKDKLVDITSALFESPGITSKRLNEELKKYRTYFKNEAIFDKATKSPVIKLDDRQLAKLRYNDKCEKANRFNITTNEHALVIGNIFNINISDIAINNKERNISLEKEVVDEFLSGNAKNVITVKNEGKTFLVDFDKELLIDMEHEEAMGVSLTFTQYNISKEDELLTRFLDFIFAEDRFVMGGAADNELKKRKRR